jgi:FixJ family two-component response regulator
VSVAINFASGPPPIGWLAALGSGSIGEFLAAADLDRPGRLAFDVRLPGQSGLDFHDGLSEANVHLLVIFISAHPDVPISVRAMKAAPWNF